MAIGRTILDTSKKVLTCDTRSRIPSGLAVGGRSCRVRSSRSVFKIDPRPGVRRRVLSVGVRAQGRSLRAPALSGEQPGEGKAGRVNVSEPLMMLRYF